MTTPAIYACLCALNFPAQALLRLRPSLVAKPVAVIEGERPWERLCSHNRSAGALGVTVGISRAEAETFPLTILRRSLIEEAAARSVLLTAASQFTPLVEDRSTDSDCLLVLQLDGTGRLFGPPKAIAAALQSHLRQLGLTVRIAISANFHAAIALARSASGKEVLHVAHGAERAALAPLPLSSLFPDGAEEHADTFASWGLKAFRDLAALDPDDVVARLGQAGRRLWQLARGEHPHHFTSIQTPFTLMEYLELDHPVDILESLLFALSPMLEQLVLRAQAHALALAALTLQLTLETHQEAGAEPAASIYRRTIRPALPTSNRPLMLKLLQLDLEAHPPPAAALTLSLTADPGPTSKVQLGLFSPQLPEPMQLEVTLARIAAIVGESHVGRARLSDTHQPDAFTMEKFVLTTTPTRTPARTQLPDLSAAGTLATRRLRPPIPLNVTLSNDAPANARPLQFFYNQTLYRIEQAFGPWQTSGNWWSPQPWSTRCWDVIARPAGQSVASEQAADATLTGTISQNLLDGLWHLDSLYD